MPKSAEESSSKVMVDELLQENARLRGDLLTVAYRIAHDLRTPLGSINVTAELIKELGANDAKIPADSIFNATEEITRMLERVSFVLKASARPVDMEKVDMGRVVFEVREKLERASLKKNAVISGPESWPEVSGVTGWLRVIWWNLLANSLHHGPDGVKIQMGWKREGDALRFWIEDNGSGIPADKVGKLFQSFHTLHEPESKRGLGLAIVRRLVELQNGRWGYEPVESGGSLFYFTLPLQQPEATVPLALPGKFDHQATLSMAGTGR